MSRWKRAWRRAVSGFVFILRGLASLYFAEVWMWTTPREPDESESVPLPIPRPRESSDALR